MANWLVELLEKKKALSTCLVTIPHPVVGELLAHVGFDFLVIDTEHTGMSGSEVQLMLQAAGSSNTPCIVRTGELSEVQTKFLLDAGARGIMVPHVNSREEAERAVRFTRYPPEGTRGVTAGRAALWGMSWDSYYRSINSDIAVVALLEESEGVANAAEIADVEGVDVVGVGLWDLSAHLGRLGDVGHPSVLQARHEAEKAIRSAGKAVLRYVESGTEAAHAAGEGAQVIILGEDVGLLLGHANQELELASRPQDVAAEPVASA
jgi:2-keto-3-deoxy-L-rhamnonate aldolase RhmA